MTNDKVCQTIHSARRDTEGKLRCVHEFVGDDGYPTAHCRHCKCPYSDIDYIPDYTTDHRAYLEAMQEFQENPWWYLYLNRLTAELKIYNKISVLIETSLILLNPLKGSHALAEWLEDNRGVWEKEEE